jgi:hypothetical protein
MPHINLLIPAHAPSDIPAVVVAKATVAYCKAREHTGGFGRAPFHIFLRRFWHRSLREAGRSLFS